MAASKDHSTPFFLAATILAFALPFLGSHWDIGLGLVFVLFGIGCVLIPCDSRSQKK